MCNGRYNCVLVSTCKPADCEDDECRKLHETLQILFFFLEFKRTLSMDFLNHVTSAPTTWRLLVTSRRLLSCSAPSHDLVTLINHHMPGAYSPPHATSAPSLGGRVICLVFANTYHAILRIVRLHVFMPHSLFSCLYIVARFPCAYIPGSLNSEYLRSKSLFHIHTATLPVPLSSLPQ